MRLAALERELRFHLALPGGRPAGAYVLGAAFAFGWTPCIGPVLGSILAISAVGNTVDQGMALLAVYSLGLGVPFVAAAFFTAGFMRHLRRLGRYGRRLQTVAGAMLVLMGVAMVSGYLTALSVWLLDALPWLQRIG
jgi:cytochrome c-type biogenesis protein